MTAEQSHKPQEAVILEPVRNGLLETGVSVQCPVEMEKESAQLDVVVDEAGVIVEASRKPRQAVILVHVLSGELESGVSVLFHAGVGKKNEP